MSENAFQFALALLELPFLDLYVQDLESGWTVLHRALYFGNVAIARALMDRDMHDAVGQSNYGSNHTVGGLIKIKDHEGNSPFDVYGASISTRIIRSSSAVPLLSDSSEDEDGGSAQGISGDGDDDGSSARVVRISPKISIGGDEIFTFGSNKNFNLGFGDEDDRQYPERLYLKRPVQLLQHFWTERKRRIRNNTRSSSPEGESPVPASIQNQPIIIQDVRLSKFHSAILTSDPEANLYTCGFGPGGRLGTGDEETRFNFVSILGGGLGVKKVIDIGLGQNHTVAVTSDGEVFSWGSNTYGQLGYNSPSSNMRDEEPIHLLPRQIFGPLKREIVRGVAASSIHTLVYTSSSLYTFGKNEGQLGLVDSDARSVVLQHTPRKVAASLFSTSINTVSAISHATICLLENHDVWIFANYGYSKVTFPLESPPNSFLHSRFWATRYSADSNRICKITSGGETICAMSSMGDVFAVNVSQKTKPGFASASTTNPSKIRGALSMPQRIWIRNKSHMAARDVDVGHDGAIIICTEAGSVWRRVKRAKIKDANTPKQTDHRPKDYKFSRVPGLTRVTAVRSNVFGAYAAVRRDCDVVRSQINVESHMIWKNLQPLLSFRDLAEYEEDSETEHPRPRLWSPRQASHSSAAISRAVLFTSNLEETVATCISQKSSSEYNAYDLRIGSTKSKVIFPVHECIVSGRSEIIRNALNLFRLNYYFSIPDVVDIEYDKEGRILIVFQEVDIITVLNLVLYMYTDEVVSVWRHTKNPTAVLSRYRSIRLELMKIASHLGLRSLEQAVRTMTDPPKALHLDMEKANCETEFYEHGDVEVELDGSNLKAHGAILCQRCPFFEGLFNGRASGLWLSARRKRSSETVKVDLRHIDPEIFKLVRRHIYADTGEDLFDDIRSPDLESFLDLILGVLSVANELMLDRLSQCCQKVLGFHVSTRNICQMLNAVAPFSVTEFKKAGLEYICVNLEGMLENHLLNELDDDLMVELDEVVRENQLTSLPISKSGRSDFELLAAYPELAARIERGKWARVDQIALQYRWRHAEASIKGQYARPGTAINEEEDENQYRSTLKGDRSNNQESPAQKSPLLRTQKSADLMFEMDEAEDNATNKGRPVTSKYQSNVLISEDVQTASSGVSTGGPWLNTK
ncbi:MAG: hypothetical protein Q9214_004108, partial [Letrouitia sp. 1 TL-2023]